MSDSLLRREREYYQKAHAAIERCLESLLADMELGKPLTRTELWQMVKYTKLKEEIERWAGIIGELQLSDIDVIASRLYSETIGLTLKEFREDSRFTTANREQVKQVLTSAFGAENYSDKVWGGGTVANRINTNSKQFAARLTKDMEDMICLGKSPNKIKEALAADFNTSYANADRLVRTEANHIYNQAAKDSYKAAGVQEIEFFPEKDGKCCDECRGYAGKYPINQAPLLPIHPNCRCCYIPVISLKSQDKQ